jgi:hypothetical protein
MATENGVPSGPATFSTGCSKFNDSCYDCLANEPHQVSFEVSAENSKVQIPQSITIVFTPSSVGQTLTNVSN